MDGPRALLPPQGAAAAQRQEARRPGHALAAPAEPHRALGGGARARRGHRAARARPRSAGRDARARRQAVPPWVDAIPRSRAGWLEEEPPPSDAERPADPRPAYEVELAPRAAAQLAWLEARGVSLEATLRTILEASPHRTPYRRIRREREGGGFVLALHEWRVAFRVDARRVRVLEVRTGYRARELADHPLHRELGEAAFPEGDA
ncbi:MAG: hypothetical protein M5U28_16425 [Sandaracinaceae bacterium]|nr:hypothetical protein [Sandaracinaceae bacterium]